MNEFRTSDSYVERVVAALYDYLLRIDDVRGTGGFISLDRKSVWGDGPAAMFRWHHRLLARRRALRYTSFYRLLSPE